MQTGISDEDKICYRLGMKLSSCYLAAFPTLIFSYTKKIIAQHSLVDINFNY